MAEQPMNSNQPDDPHDDGRAVQPPPELTRLVRGTLASTVAGIFALSAFTVSVLAGLSIGNGATSILVRALIAMAVCYPIGLAVGLVADRVVREQIEQHRKTHPEEGQRVREGERATAAHGGSPSQTGSSDQTEEDVLIV